MPQFQAGDVGNQIRDGNLVFCVFHQHPTGQLARGDASNSRSLLKVFNDAASDIGIVL
ncbi:MAG: hypothetical protein M3439_10970 [Chloroflexota bacterium]|nr:hypothetical protein [Chloroflexota bacterium]